MSLIYLVLGLPISLLWGVTMPRRKKAVLVAVFSLTIFTIIVTIVRGTLQIGKIERGLSNPDAIGWVCFWLVVESTTGKSSDTLGSLFFFFFYFFLTFLPPPSLRHCMPRFLPVPLRVQRTIPQELERLGSSQAGTTATVTRIRS